MHKNDYISSQIILWLYSKFPLFYKVGHNTSSINEGSLLVQNKILPSFAKTIYHIVSK